MKVQQKDFYHGVALTQIVEHPSFKALNRASGHYGHYRINADTQIFVKYRTHNKGVWQFPFSRAEIARIRKAVRSRDAAYICLVCGGTTVCVLNEDEVAQVLNLQGRGQSLTVELPPRSSLRVRGSAGDLDHAIPNNAFPDDIFS